MNEIKFTFDGNYLVAELDSSIEIVKYQMEMIIHNSINYLLPVKRQIANNCTYLYYEVVGRMSVDRLVMHKKLSDDAYLNFVKGALSAVREMGEYQLSVTGVVLDNRYVFMHPTEYTPYFVYLPIENNGDGLLMMTNYLKNMFSSGMIEIKNINVINQIIGVLNSDLSLNEMLLRLSNGGTSVSQQQSTRSSAIVPPRELAPSTNSGYTNMPPVSETPVIKPEVSPMVTRAPERPEPQTMPKPNGSVINIPKSGNVPEEKKGKPDKATKKTNKGSDSETQVGKPNMKKIRPILMGVGVGIIIIFALLYSSGTFTDDNGNDDYSVLIAVPILIVVADYFIYSKLKTKYVITDEEIDEKKPNQKIVKKGAKEVYVPVTEVKAPSPVPVQQSTSTSPVQSYPSTPMGYTQPIAPTEITGFSNNQSFVDYGKTEVLSENELNNPYLQSRGGSRIDISSQITRIGKLRDQVDVLIPNTKVSRVHADIVMRDGKLYVIDLGSANGTYINGDPNRITSNMEYELHNNDKVVFANEEYTVHC